MRQRFSPLPRFLLALAELRADRVEKPKLRTGKLIVRYPACAELTSVSAHLVAPNLLRIRLESILCASSCSVSTRPHRSGAGVVEFDDPCKFEKTYPPVSVAVCGV